MLTCNPRLKSKTRSLRARPTDAERRLWVRVRRKQILGVQFYRQKAIGNCIVDFYAPAAHLVVEVDGFAALPSPASRARQTANDILGAARLAGSALHRSPGLIGARRRGGGDFPGGGRGKSLLPPFVKGGGQPSPRMGYFVLTVPFLSR